MFKDLAWPWQRALTLAWLSLREGGLPIGAVVLDAKGECIAEGRNRYFTPGATVTCHAELSALGVIPLAQLEQKLTLYTTVEPCPMCFGAINVARVSELYFGTRDMWSGSTGLAGGNFYMQRKTIAITHERSLERLCCLLLHHGMVNRPNGLPLSHEIISRTEMILPDIRSILPEMAIDPVMNGSVEDVVNHIMARFRELKRG